MLQVAMLGQVVFTVDGVVTRADLGQSGRLLACYLFEFAGRTHRRERLADVFWPDLDSERAGSALNTAIWRIRKLLSLDGSGRCGRQLITSGNDLVLETLPSISIDTHLLQRAIKRALSLSSGVLGREMAAELDSAVDFYGGPFLDGDDADWILQERERLHCLCIRGLIELMRYSARQESLEGALEYGRRILAIDALRESIQRDVMLLLVLNGQRADAIQNFQKLRELLKDELGIEPMPETTRMADDIISGEIFGQLKLLKRSHFWQAECAPERGCN